MKKFIPVLMETKLFDGVAADDIEAMLSCLQATVCTYKKGGHIYRQGDNIHRIAVPVEGSIIIQNFDYWGNRSIINMIGSVDYTEKLTAIIRNNNIKSVTIVRMEVPCCGGIENAAKNAIRASGKFIPWQVVTISTDGRKLR